MPQELDDSLGEETWGDMSEDPIVGPIVEFDVRTMSDEAFDCMLATEAVLACDWDTETSDAAWETLSEAEKDRAQKWDKAVEQELEEHAEAWKRLAKE